MEVSENQVHQLISTQFPQWAHLAIRPVEVGGWDTCLARGLRPLQNHLRAAGGGIMIAPFCRGRDETVLLFTA